MKEQKNKVVVYNGANQHSFSAQANCLVTLNAGQNVVSIEKLDRLMGTTGDEEKDKCKSVSFLEAIDDGAVQIIEDAGVEVATTTEKENKTGTKTPADDTIKINIVDLGVKDAKSVISSEIDADVIQGYLDAEIASDEPRTSVVKACESAIDGLLKADDAGSDDAGNT